MTTESLLVRSADLGAITRYVKYGKRSAAGRVNSQNPPPGLFGSTHSRATSAVKMVKAMASEVRAPRTPEGSSTA